MLPHPALAPRQPVPYYVERQPTIAEIVAWALRNDLRHRLRSLISPPGAGKSTTLYQLLAVPEHPEKLLVFPVLNLKTVRDSRSLWEWLKNCNVDVGLNLPLQAPGEWEAPYVVSQVGISAYNLCVRCGAKLVLIPVDALEETVGIWRGAVEQFLVQVLSHPNVRIILTRRDEYTLTEANLRWEEDVTILKPLPDPEEQVISRLENPGHGVAWSWREPWEDELDQWIATLTAAQRDQCLDALRPALTPGPIINLLLLDRLRQGSTELGPDDFRACLAVYLQRAGLPAVPYVQSIIDLGRAEDFCRTGFYKRADYSGPDTILPSLLTAGVVYSSPYRFEPGVVALICRIWGVAAPEV